MENKLTEHIYNIGTGVDITIKELSNIVKKIIGYRGKILWDINKPDGTPRKLMDISRMNKIGWSYSTDLENGIKKTYQWFLKNINNIKKNKF